MTTATAAAPTRAAAPALTLDERLALSLLAMDDRLTQAGADYLIRTARIDLPEILVEPIPAIPQPVPAATVPEVFAEAARLIEVHGWIPRYLGNPDTGYCLIGAIRAAAGGDNPLADQACDVIYDRIRQESPDALSIGDWNDRQTQDGPALRILGH